MMRSMYSGISGLRAHQVRMDVIGNNIANVNTVGFKGSRVTFQEIYNQTLKSPSAPSQTGRKGGSNPQQVGLGVSVSSIDVLHSRGSVQRTDKATDLAIDGDGFFVVSDGVSKFYTRAGNFDVDRLGNLVTAGGLKVLGWSTKMIDPNTGEEVVDTSKVTDSINLANLSMNAKATDKIRFEGNLNADSTDPVEYAVSVFDSQGYEHKVNFVFTKYEPNVWGWKLVPALNSGVDHISPYVDGTTTPLANSFDYDGDGTPDIPAGSEHGLLVFGPDGKLDTTASSLPSDITITLDSSTNGADDITFSVSDNGIEFNPDKFTQYAAETTVKAGEINGYAPGTLNSISIDSEGRIIGIYSNGQAREDAVLAVSRFSNPGGLSKLGDNLFQNTSNSGDPITGRAGIDGRGVINPGALEMSNVDLAKEFTEMIVAQRGFQANSRIITTSDELLQELVNLKR